MKDKPLDCIGVDSNKQVIGKHDFQEKKHIELLPYDIDVDVKIVSKVIYNAFKHVIGFYEYNADGVAKQALNASNAVAELRAAQAFLDENEALKKEIASLKSEIDWCRDRYKSIACENDDAYIKMVVIEAVNKRLEGYLEEVAHAVGKWPEDLLSDFLEEFLANGGKPVDGRIENDS